MFVTLQGENYTANFYLFLVIHPLNREENSENLRCSFNVFSNSARQLEVPLSLNLTSHQGILLICCIGGVSLADNGMFWVE